VCVQCGACLDVELVIGAIAGRNGIRSPRDSKTAKKTARPLPDKNRFAGRGRRKKVRVPSACVVSEAISRLGLRPIWFGNGANPAPSAHSPRFDAKTVWRRCDLNDRMATLSRREQHDFEEYSHAYF
jgi:hypothetical protein